MHLVNKRNLLKATGRMQCWVGWVENTVWGRTWGVRNKLFPANSSSVLALRRLGRFAARCDEWRLYSQAFNRKCGVLKSEKCGMENGDCGSRKMGIRKSGKWGLRLSKCRVWKMRTVEENAECGKSKTEVENEKCGKWRMWYKMRSLGENCRSECWKFRVR